jgi:hypothetical protein
VIRRPQDDGWSVLVNVDNLRSVALKPTADLVWRTPDGTSAAMGVWPPRRLRRLPTKRCASRRERVAALPSPADAAIVP